MTEQTLVIGGGGYIGSHLVPSLLSVGRKVTVLGRSSAPIYKLPTEVNYLAGDYSDAQLLNKLLGCHQEVIHLAYASVPNTSFDHPLDDLLQNLPPALQLFLGAAQKQVKLILVSSGGTVYGNSHKLLIDELHPTKPISPYGVTKLTLENYASLYAATSGLKFICVRPANAYGLGQRPFIGQGFIATALASAIQNKSIKIFGEKGTVRDYLYVSDLASGIVHALEKGHLSETYNIGSGVGLSNLDVIDAINLLMKNNNKNPVFVENLAERPFDVKSNILDSAKLKTHTGWEPAIDFNNGLYRTYQWMVGELKCH